MKKRPNKTVNISKLMWTSGKHILIDSVHFLIYLLSAQHVHTRPVPGPEWLKLNEIETWTLPCETHSSPGRLKHCQGLLLARNVGTEEECDLGSTLGCLDSHRTSPALWAPRPWPGCFIFLSLHFFIRKNKKNNGSHLIELWALNETIYVKCLVECMLHSKS